MKRTAFIIGLFCLLGIVSCHSDKKDSPLMTRDFLPSGWERFDFIKNELEIGKPTTFNLIMEATFDNSYPFDYISVVFSVFDEEENPLRSKSYKFSLKDNDGQWQSESKDGLYKFTFPINSEMSFNDPGKYILQLENRMPITPLVGIRHISMVAN